VPRNAVCFLSVPTNKTGTAFVKPVDHVVGEAIVLWERIRPIQPAMVDHKTEEVVHYLFCYRARRMGQDYVNDTVIPMLCRKAGVPEQDARGNITSHRARSTIASQLFNAKEPRKSGLTQGGRSDGKPCKNESRRGTWCGGSPWG
jgi:hypothetical protein